MSRSKICKWQGCKSEATKYIRRKIGFMQLCEKHAEVVEARISKRTKTIMEVKSQC